MANAVQWIAGDDSLKTLIVCVDNSSASTDYDDDEVWIYIIVEAP